MSELNPGSNPELRLLERPVEEPDEDTLVIDESFRELNKREFDGITIRLLWDPSSDALWVDVQDDKTGRDFRLAVEERERAMEYFNHPYAYIGNIAVRGAQEQVAES
jgi:hypothetical protein